MDGTFEVSLRGPKGEAREIRCTSHEGCTWKLPTPNAVSDKDPIALAMFASHLKTVGTPARNVGGHMRRARQ